MLDSDSGLRLAAFNSGLETDHRGEGDGEAREPTIRIAALLPIAMLASCGDAAEKTPMPVEPVGRYQIAAVPGTTQAILLNTATGQTWYRVSTGPSDKEDVTQWLPMDKTGQREWMELNAPRPDTPKGAHPYRP